jgi:CRISPR-associated endonuclease/helicase Cas3
VAGRLHDIGKAHPSFQEMLLATEPAARHELELRGPWAKSARGKGPRNKRRYFRHELVSALALLDEGASLLEGVAEPDLVRYLVAAHHGRVRLGFRPMPDEGADSDDSRVALGVHDGELVGPIAVPGGEVPASTMRLSVMELGSSNGPSWGQRMLTLRDRADLGPFRLAFLEALVRLADWRVSASYEVEGD